MRVCRKEPTIDELLTDPMMEPVLNYSRTTADEVRSLMGDVAARRAVARESYSEPKEGYGEPLADSRPTLGD